MSWLMYATRSTTPDDLALERLRLLRAGVREDPVPHLRGQVQLLGDPQRLLVVMEAGAEPLSQAGVEPLLAGVAERRVAHVVPEPDRLGQILVQPQRPGDDAGDARRLQRVRDPGAVVVAGGVDEDLRLALQPPERLRVDDPVAVALERRPDAALVLLAEAPPRLVGANGARRQRALFVRADARLEGVSDSSGQLRHEVRVSRWADLAGALEQSVRTVRSCGSIVAEDLHADTCRIGHVRGQSPDVSREDGWRVRTGRSDDDRDGAAVR